MPRVRRNVQRAHTQQTQKEKGASSITSTQRTGNGEPVHVVDEVDEAEDQHGNPLPGGDGPDARAGHRILLPALLMMLASLEGPGARALCHRLIAVVLHQVLLRDVRRYPAALMTGHRDDCRGRNNRLPCPALTYNLSTTLCAHFCPVCLRPVTWCSVHYLVIAVLHEDYEYTSTTGPDCSASWPRLLHLMRSRLLSLLAAHRWRGAGRVVCVCCSACVWPGARVYHATGSRRTTARPADNSFFPRKEERTVRRRACLRILQITRK